MFIGLNNSKQSKMDANLKKNERLLVCLCRPFRCAFAESVIIYGDCGKVTLKYRAEYKSQIF